MLDEASQAPLNQWLSPVAEPLLVMVASLRGSSTRASRAACRDSRRGLLPSGRRARASGSRRLIVEIDEDQHRKAVLIFDKPGRMTVSGVARSERCMRSASA